MFSYLKVFSGTIRNCYLLNSDSKRHIFFRNWFSFSVVASSSRGAKIFVSNDSFGTEIHIKAMHDFSVRLNFSNLLVVIETTK